MLDLQLMESTITDEVYVEGVVETISNFFDDLIEKIKEMFDEAQRKIREKMLEAKFQKMCKEIKKLYAKDKSILAGKKIKFFDYNKYYKEATKHIHDMHTLIMELRKKDFKSFDDLSKWEHDMYKSHNWDITSDIEKYYFDVLASDVIGQIDGYADSIIETSNKIKNEMINAEEEAKRLAAEEAAREKTDSDNVSKMRIFKKIGNKICQFGKNVTSYMPYVGYKSLEFFFRMNGMVHIYNGVQDVHANKFIQAGVKGVYAAADHETAEWAKEQAQKSFPNK